VDALRVTRRPGVDPVAEFQAAAAGVMAALANGMDVDQGDGGADPDVGLTFQMPTRTPAGPGTPRRKELQRLERDLKRMRWNIDAGLKDAIIARMRDVVEDPKATRRLKMRAAKIIMGAEEQNQADQHLAIKNGRLDAGELTEHVAIEQVIIERVV